MLFQWDEEKNRSNIAKHGISFEIARQIFNGFTLDRIDDRFNYGEIREISIGRTGDLTILVVVHTERDGSCRIISARPAIRTEKRIYEQAVYKAFDS